jgi:hypothetical protein
VARRRKTIAEARFPTTAEFGEIARSWPHDATIRLLELVWAGCDALHQDIVSRVSVNEAGEDLERSLTMLLEPRIRRSMTGDEPFDVQHGTYEHETRLPAPAQPPQYDLAFVLSANPRVVWPIEAKVLRTDQDIAPYVTELRQNYLSCRYAPFSASAAMLGYLVVGSPHTAFQGIAKSANVKLRQVSAFSGRPHRLSKHQRMVPRGRPYVRKFECHHLIFVLSKDSSGNPDSE